MVLEGVGMDLVRGVSLAGARLRLLSEDNEELDCVEGDLVGMGVLVGKCSTGVRSVKGSDGESSGKVEVGSWSRSIQRDRFF